MLPAAGGRVRVGQPCQAYRLVGRMIMEIVGEQFVEQLPITTALHFDRVATDNRLSCLADVVGHHHPHFRLESIPPTTSSF